VLPGDFFGDACAKRPRRRAIVGSLLTPAEDKDDVNAARLHHSLARRWRFEGTPVIVQLRLHGSTTKFVTNKVHRKSAPTGGRPIGASLPHAGGGTSPAATRLRMAGQHACDRRHKNPFCYSQERSALWRLGHNVIGP
jgi:hypothetical protein